MSQATVESARQARSGFTGPVPPPHKKTFFDLHGVVVKVDTTLVRLHKSRRYTLLYIPSCLLTKIWPGCTYLLTIGNIDKSVAIKVS